MSWTSPEDMRKQLERRWKNGDVLCALVRGGDTFPLRLRLSVPSTRELATDLSRAQEWIATLRTLRGLRVEWRGVRSLTLGKQELPHEVWVDTADDAVTYLNREEEVRRLLALHADASRTLPELTTWIEARPDRTLDLEPVWDSLMRVVAWRRDHPALPPVYVRQIDLPGIDSKFIERHATILAELFDTVSPPNEAPDAATEFRTRYGFLREPGRIRFRVLDPHIRFAGLAGCPDVELDEDGFAGLSLAIRRVFVTENKTNFLAFPPVDHSLVVFGAGYGMRAFGRAHWIRELPLYYWGDIDTHGFAILSELRSFFPHAQAFLMDEQTMMACQPSWTSELKPARSSLLNLCPDEMALFMKLQHGHALQGLRLEQEKVPMAAVQAALRQILQMNRSGTQADEQTGSAPF